MSAGTPLLRHDLDALSVLVARTAMHLQLDPAFVEKDFWVTEVLRSVCRTRVIKENSGGSHHVGVIFKGGTSLSRVYGITERFSEDVDIVLVFPPSSGLGARHALLKQVCQDARLPSD